MVCKVQGNCNNYLANNNQVSYCGVGLSYLVWLNWYDDDYSQAESFEKLRQADVALCAGYKIKKYILQNQSKNFTVCKSLLPNLPKETKPTKQNLPDANFNIFNQHQLKILGKGNKMEFLEGPGLI